MENIGQFTELGLGIATLVILFVVVRYFIKAISKKDDQILNVLDKFHKISESFNETVSNHISHHTDQAEKQIVVMKELSDGVKELTKEIKNGR